MAVKTEKGTDFILKVNGIELPADVRERIAAELRATLMRELAKTDTGGGKSGAKGSAQAAGLSSGVLIPAEWNGGIYFRSIANLRDIATRFDKMRFETREVAM